MCHVHLFGLTHRSRNKHIILFTSDVPVSAPELSSVCLTRSVNDDSCLSPGGRRKPTITQKIRWKGRCFILRLYVGPYLQEYLYVSEDWNSYIFTPEYGKRVLHLNWVAPIVVTIGLYSLTNGLRQDYSRFDLETYHPTKENRHGIIPSVFIFRKRDLKSCLNYVPIIFVVTVYRYLQS